LFVAVWMYPDTAEGFGTYRMSNWFRQEIDDVLAELDVDPGHGLESAEVARRRARYGANRLRDGGGRKPLGILLDQFKSLMVLLLIAAALVSGLMLGEREDALVIAVVVVLNAALGFRQEFKAEKAMAALKKLSSPLVRVRRGGADARIPAAELVPGDIVLLEAGNIVPADCRLVETANLRIQESALTGEAEPVEKNTQPPAGDDAALGDRTDMAHMGTIVTYGRGTGVVIATGMQSELGRIATMIQEARKEDTVLQKKLHQLSKVLVGAALALIAVIAAEGAFVQQMPVKDLFMTAVSMAVAAIPEGLPAVVTISLALGAQRMLRRRALIRRLPAVETLGSVTVICSDKTGTLTENRMTVTTLAPPARRIDLPEDAQLRARELKAERDRDEAVAFILAGAALCNDAAQAGGGDGIVGDPTEAALVAAAAWTGWDKSYLEERLRRVNEAPFDSERKRMTTVHEFVEETVGAEPSLSRLREWARSTGADAVAFSKGAPDSILEKADRIWVDGAARPLRQEERESIGAANEALAAEGIRVLGVAMREAPQPAGPAQSLESGLVYLGMIGMRDPLRAEVRPAVAVCHKAGIRPIMITGDHPLIATTIGRELDLHSPGGHRTGRDLAAMDRKTLEREVRDVSIYARVSPEHKLRIVDALQKNGQIVAMTGDGVNDAPALKEADIGVAMGITGTDVSREAADMVLQDDNFATIVAAVEQGRVILDNIIRFVRYILASNWAEILVMALAPFFGLPLPLYPVQILWMNLVTDGLPALALGVEPGEREVMRRPPRSPDAPIIDRATAIHILLVGGLMAVLSLVLGYFFQGSGTEAADAGGGAHYGAVTVWQTMVFTVLVFSQLTLALAERSTNHSFFRIGVFSNPHMIGAIVLTSALQLCVVYVPFLQRFFRTVGLSARQLALCLAVSLAVFVFVELKKQLIRRKK